MITIKKNNPINLDIPKFTCDNNVLGEHLNNHDALSLFNCYGFLCVIGRPGQGKTSLALSLITGKNPRILKKCFHHILVCMPTNSINSLAKNPFRELNPVNIYEELNAESIEDMYNKINNWSSEDEKTLLFIDDQTASLKSSKIVEQTLKKLIYNRRHLKLFIIITSQSYVNLPLDIRKNISQLITFKPSKKEMEIIFNELIENKKNLFIDIMKEVYDEKHNFLFLNVNNQRMFKNFDEIILNDSIET